MEFEVSTTYVLGTDGQNHVAWQTPYVSSVILDPTSPEWAQDPDAEAVPVEDQSGAMSLARPAASQRAVAARPDSTEVSYHRREVAKYARQWTDKDHDGNNEVMSGYPQDLSNNCANFVSIGLHHAGGWETESSFLSTPSDPEAWDWDLPILGVGPTRTWTQASSLYRYMHEQRGLAPIHDAMNAVKGEVMFWDWEGDKKINHTTIVSGRTKSGVPRISAKTNNRHNMLLTVWLNDIVYPDHPDVIGWGVHYWKYKD